MAALAEALDAYAVVDVAGLPETALVMRAEELLAARDRLDGLLAATLAAVDARDATVAECGRGTRAWLVEEQRRSPAEAARRMFVARRYARWPLLAAALETGEVSHDHARAIVGCLPDLPEPLQPESERILVDAARELDPSRLGRVVHELLTRTGADDVAEQREERRFASRWATVARTFDGMVHVEAMLEPVGGEAALTVLNALAGRTGTEDDRTRSQRLADALVELAEHRLGCAALPDTAGLPTRVVVTVDLDALSAGVGWGRLEGSGEPLSVAAIRRLGCDTGVIPAVLGGAGEVLDLGRTTYSWSAAQRRAARLRDRHCTFPGCRVGLDRCRLHHIEFWSHDGGTDLANSAHLCPFHHWLVHHTAWRLRREPDGQLVVTSPRGEELRAPPAALAA